MKNLLNHFVTLLEQSEEFQRELVNFQNAIKTPQWKFYNQVLMIIKGTIAHEMFSRHFTDLDPKEKDVMQRTYFNIDQMLIFLLNPLKWIRKRSRWQENLTNLIKRKEQK